MLAWNGVYMYLKAMREVDELHFPFSLSGYFWLINNNLEENEHVRKHQWPLSLSIAMLNYQRIHAWQFWEQIPLPSTVRHCFLRISESQTTLKWSSRWKPTRVMAYEWKFHECITCIYIYICIYTYVYTYNMNAYMISIYIYMICISADPGLSQGMGGALFHRSGFLPFNCSKPDKNRHNHLSCVTTFCF